MSRRIRGLVASVALSFGAVALSVLMAAPANAAVVEPAQASTTAQISQVSTQGPGGTLDEFIELQNVQSSSLDISGYTVWACTSTGRQVLLATLPPGTILGGTTPEPGVEAGRFLLLANTNYTRAVPPDVTYTGDVQRLGGVLLRGAPTATNPMGARIDAVGFSRFLPCTESLPAQAQSSTFVDQSVIRFGDIDTNNNGFDFTLIAPSFPRNSTFTSSFPTSFHSVRVQ